MSSTPPPRPYFPRAGFRQTQSISTLSLPSFPDTVAPVFDVEQAKQPLGIYNDKHHNAVYPPQDDKSDVPPIPDDFADPYLYPYLARTERLRLTLLWYYTRHVEEDSELLSVIDNTVNTLQKYTGWEFAICGILDESTYLRLGTANLPLLRIPRREGTCSHTVNQAIGSVLMFTDMSKDWRFRHSPHVRIGGLRSYAGTPLRMTTEDGQHVAMGSLCVASETPQPPLTDDAKITMVRFANLLSAEIASRSRYHRSKERQVMSDTLAELKTQVDSKDFEKLIVKAIQRIYPGAHVTVQHSLNDSIELEDGQNIAFTDVQEGLWEDTAHIDMLIETSNFRRLKSTQSVRAIVAQCGKFRSYVVVSSYDIRYVFDDIDAWFVERCASMEAEVRHNRLLQEALKAKQTFLRGITHQLRTPIHGVLGSVELLTEELNTMNLLSLSENYEDAQSRIFSPSTYLATIRNSGHELMTTINNIIKLHNWADDANESNENTIYDVYELEHSIMSNVLELVPEEELNYVSIRLESQLATGHYIVTANIMQLKECLQSLLLNAIQSVSGHSGGIVTISVSTDSSQSKLTFDFIDTGPGIRFSDQARIFDPYEKVNSHKPGAGLGLTLARMCAESLGGSITLVSSSPGCGSHFRVEFMNPIFACPADPTRGAGITLAYLPHSYAEVRSSADNHMVDHFVKHCELYGFEKIKEISGAALVITDIMPETLLFATHFSDLNTRTVIVCYSHTQNIQRIRRLSTDVALIIASGPFCTFRLNEILKYADSIYGSLASSGHDKAVHGRLVAPSLGIRASEIEKDADDSVPSSNLESSLRPPECLVNTGSLRALLVDDNAINLRILQMFCKKRHIPYVLAKDGHNAIKAFEKAADTTNPITLVLMDLQMPECDGLEATKAIRTHEIEHGLARTPIFMITGQDSLKDKVDSIDAGCDEFLVKPVRLKLLEQYITGYLGPIQSTN